MVAVMHQESVSAQVLLGMAIILAASIGGRLSMPKSSR